MFRIGYIVSTSGNDQEQAVGKDYADVKPV